MNSAPPRTAGWRWWAHLATTFCSRFDPISLQLPRDGHKDLHLLLCDDIYYMDRKKERIERFQYDFERDGVSTRGLKRDGVPIPAAPKREAGEIVSDHRPEEYMAGVETVRGRHAPGRILRSGAAADLSS